MKHRILALAIVAAAAASSLTACDSKAPTAGAAQTVVAPELTAAQAYDAIIKSGTGFAVGAADAKQTVYVFFDPQCPHCAHLWQAAQPLLDSVKFVWMPVGLLSRASAPQGATIIGAADPVKAMNENEQSIADQGNGITANSDAVSRLSAKVDMNSELFKKAASPDDGVPFIVTKVGGAVRIKSGALPTDQLKEFLGLTK
ncbi:thioredoxin domain-containing protein [Burkholderia cenocepacia]|uniref:thioredoxin domain-containing protein n=1 Tax=Burkholderia cenocepacia TaxID=95486 RepID=UPI0007612E57|nr:thioredoxin domain-containing protein [Burkholderia cenocepacia]KWU19161.1 hypothetical protein AS149_13010 [Burkholderia cenocepacia]